MESARKKILIVDDEEDLLRSLERRISHALPDLEVRAETRAEDALLRILGAEHALVITDVRMPGMSGLELLLRARQRWSALPFVVMTAFPTEALEREAMTLGSVHYLEKPFPIAALIELVQDILARQQTPGFSGEVSAATLPDLMQLFFMSSSTGALRVWHGKSTASIWFDRGVIVHATADALQGRTAVFEAVSWEGGMFSMDLNIAAPVRSVEEGTTGLMLEAVRRADERRNGRIPATEDLIIDELLDDYGELDDDTLTDQKTEGEKKMPNVNSNLERLRAIDGYIGSCIVDSESAMSLGSDGGGALLNLDVAAAGNAEVVKAKRKAIRALGLKDEIEDILISLGKQYHLIRPLRSRPGVFIYVALERSRANLAMARLTVADVEKMLEL